MIDAGAEAERRRIVAWLKRGGQWDDEMQRYADAFALAIRAGMHLEHVTKVPV